MSTGDEDTLRERFAAFLDSLGLENLTANYRDEKREADSELERAFDPLPEELAVQPEVAEIDKVNVHRDGGDVLVPVVPLVFAEAGEPPMDAVWEFTVDVLNAIHPTFQTHHVRHYDLQFGYANADETEAVFRRITVGQTLTDYLVRDATVDVDTLREQVQNGDDGDDGVPPVYWQEFDARSPAGSGSYTGAAPIYTACSSATSSAVYNCLDSDDSVYYVASGGAF